MRDREKEREIICSVEGMGKSKSDISKERKKRG